MKVIAGLTRNLDQKQMLVIKFYYVYMLSNYANSVLYIGVTNSLQRRILEHKVKFNSESFTSKYNCSKLVYYETFEDISNAIAREKQLKNWKREWKNELIEKENKEWNDLAKDWYAKQELKYKSDKDAESGPA